MGKLLIVPMLTFGHFNACVNIGRLLIDRHPEHEIYFLASDKWADKLAKWEPRFKSLVYMKDEDAWKRNNEMLEKERKINGDQKQESQKNGYDSLSNLIDQVGNEWEKPTIEGIKKLNGLLTCCLETMYDHRTKIEQLVEELDPDVIAFDTIIMIPFLLKRKYIQIMTMNPLFMDHPRLPPYSSGLSSNKAATFEQWKEYRLTNLKHTADYTLYLNSLLLEEGEECIRPPNLINPSPFFNVYVYPREIDYYSMDPQIRLPGKWLQLDSSLMPTKSIEPFDLNDRKGRFKRLKELYDVPDDFLQPDTKLIYFSLGTIASAYRKLMNRLIDLIGNVPPPYKFVVSKGPSTEISLPKNCVGQDFVDQFETLFCVDLMISHGG